MIVYGDQRRETTVAAQCDRVENAARAVAGTALDWHGAVARLLIEGAGLLQGIADAEMTAAGGVDAGSARQDRLMTTLVAVAGALDRSWRSGLADQRLPPIMLPAATDAAISVRRAEGFAYYALYPELHAAAARMLPPGTAVIGLRSIGAALAPIVAAAGGARSAATVRPAGHPFGRTLAVGDDLARRIATRPVALVDEGPGLSGSSLGGAVDWLEGRGMPASGIHILPGHDGPPGAEASARDRARWSSLRRHVAAFDDVLLAGRRPLARWFEDLTGPAIEPLEDLAGGRWRARSPAAHAPADPAREARKWRLVTAAGAYRIKFVGIDAGGVEAFARAQLLAAAGFSVAPLALRYGMLLEPWIYADAIGVPGGERVDLLVRYLRVRAERLPADAVGASLVELAAMARFNLGCAIGEGRAERLLAGWPDERLAAMRARVGPIHVDGRLHAWEWLRAGGRVLKTDAVDHSQSHDLVGPQDVGWDVAGAIAEFELDAGEADRLIAALDTSPDLVAFYRIAYLGFQLGWWSGSGDPRGQAQAQSYARTATRLAEAL